MQAQGFFLEKVSGKNRKYLLFFFFPQKPKGNFLMFLFQKKTLKIQVFFGKSPFLQSKFSWIKLPCQKTFLICSY